MKYVNAYRAQYFIDHLSKQIADLENSWSSNLFSNGFAIAVQPFVEELIIELDQILLPTIAYEIALNRKEGLLVGNSPITRYESFYVQNGGFTNQAKELVNKYPFLFEMIDKKINNAFVNLKNCLNRYFIDCDHINKHFEILDRESSIEQIGLVKNSDWHRNQKIILLTLVNGKKILYKPTDLRADQLFADFVDFLDLPYSFDLKCMRCLPKNHEYGWIEFIIHKPCQREEDVENFFKRAGVLLAITEALNYSDGHCENLIAYGEYPILLDGETFFQNYSLRETEKPHVFSTQLIQDLSSESEKRQVYSAFQSPASERMELFHTHPIDDNTDYLKVSYTGISNERNQNCPFIGNQYFTGANYPSQMILGYSLGYDLISMKRDKILKNNNWWNSLEKINCRTVLRATRAYMYLNRIIQQPQGCSSKEVAYQLLGEKLKSSPYNKYECLDILDLNVPIFYHRPGERHLFDGHNTCYKNAFSKPATVTIKTRLNERCEKTKEKNCQLIEKHLGL